MKPIREEVNAVIKELWDWRGYWVVCSPESAGDARFYIGCPVFSLCGYDHPTDEGYVIAERSTPEEWDEQIDKIAEVRPEWTKATRSIAGGKMGMFFRCKKVKDCDDYIVKLYEQSVADEATL